MSYDPISTLNEQKPRLPLPEPTAFLVCAGTWQFMPGELDIILAALDQIRKLDLGEHNVSAAESVTAQ